MAHIYTLSLKNGIFPKQLKCSRVVPIFKNGDTKDCNNYRPISLVPIFSKIIEKIVSYKLTNHLQINNLLTPNQFGFQRNLSCEHNLIHLTNFISNSLNENKYAIGIFLDLQKAFDVVSHEILLKKLENFGIKNTELQWFKSYLTDRNQVVDINGTTSNPNKINISVMQGSVLGPLLFLCFINDLPNASKLLKTLLFADETCALDSDDDLQVLFDRWNRELQKITNWFIINKISVNASKCKFILFNRPRKKLPTPLPQLYLNFNIIGNNENPLLKTPLERISSGNQNPDTRYYKYLGIRIDENLSFSSHIDYVCSKLNRALFCLNRVKHILSKKALITLYYSLFHSHLLYCNIILNCASPHLLKKITILQKKAIRTITNSPYNAHTTPLFLQLKILPFDEILKNHRCQFIHSVYFNYAHISFKNIWKLNLQRDTDITLRNQNNFQLPLPKTDAFKRSPLYTLPKTWNDLDPAEKCHENPYTFKILIKERWFRQMSAELELAQ